MRPQAKTHCRTAASMDHRPVPVLQAAGENALPDGGIYEQQTGTGVTSRRQNRMAGQWYRNMKEKKMKNEG